MSIQAYFHAPTDTPLLHPRAALEAMQPFAQWLGEKEPELKDWYLQGGSLEEARQYRAFDEGFNGRDAAVAVLTQSFRNAPVVGLWNGKEQPGEGATMTLSMSTDIYSHSHLTIDVDSPLGTSRIGDYRAQAELLTMAVIQLDPFFASIYEQSVYKLVFKDRPGVGWMAFVPREISRKDLPEAQALIPVTSGTRLYGTIVVTLTEEAFNERDPEHTKVAHAVETALVGQDLLPTYGQFVRPPQD